MRVGLDISAVTTGRATGIETYTRAFFKALTRVEGRGHSYYVFTTRDNQVLLDGLPEWIRPAWLPGTNERRWWRIFLQQTVLPYLAHRLRLDVVNFQSNLSALAVPTASVLHIKTLHHFQEAQSIPWNQRLVRNLLYQPSADRAEVIIANTESTRRDICHYLKVPEDKIVLISEGVDTDLFRPATPDEREIREQHLAHYQVSRPYVLFVSSLFPYKNASTLIDAFAMAMARQPEELAFYSLVIVGGDVAGHMNDLRRQALDRGLDRRVVFAGHVADRELIRSFYVGADLFVYPSRYETFGLTVLEAMACGTPVIASNATSLPEVVGDAGLLVDPMDSEAMAQEICRVLMDAPLRQGLIERGLVRAQQFAWERTVSQTVDAYELAFQRRKMARKGHS
jgi:glycosyltransferase involved in cell wall biosynthesis